MNRADLRISFLISIREDVLAKLDAFKGRIPNLFDNYLRIEHLDRDARQAIEMPLVVSRSPDLSLFPDRDTAALCDGHNLRMRSVRVARQERSDGRGVVAAKP
jgi:hypothetical protein